MNLSKSFPKLENIVIIGGVNHLILNAPNCSEIRKLFKNHPANTSRFLKCVFAF